MRVGRDKARMVTIRQQLSNYKIAYLWVIYKWFTTKIEQHLCILKK